MTTKESGETPWSLIFSTVSFWLAEAKELRCGTLDYVMNSPFKNSSHLGPFRFGPIGLVGGISGLGNNISDASPEDFMAQQGLRIILLKEVYPK